MSEATEKPSIEESISEQSRLIVSLQGRLKEAIDQNSAEDLDHFAQALMAATQTWFLLVEAGEKMKPRKRTTEEWTKLLSQSVEKNPYDG